MQGMKIIKYVHGFPNEQYKMNYIRIISQGEIIKEIKHQCGFQSVRDFRQKNTFINTIFCTKAKIQFFVFVFTIVAWP